MDDASVELLFLIQAASARDSVQNLLGNLESLSVERMRSTEMSNE